MKIAHIAPPWIAIPPKNYGGTEIVLYNLIEEQVAQGHDVTLFAPGDAKTSAKLVSFYPQSLVDTGVPWQGHLKAYYHLFKAVEYIKGHNFDILHTHLSSGADMYIFPLTAHLATPHITTLHSCFPFDRVQTWHGDADDLYMEWAASVPIVAISASARDEVPHQMNFVGVVHHGMPLAHFRPTVEKPDGFFAWLGRIMPDKGTHLAIEAAKKAGVPLVIAGTVDRHMQEAVDYFEDLVKPHIDGEQIKYIGPVNMQQKIDLLSRARGLLNPLQWEEPFGMVMIEAMAVGCPVIAFARGAAPEIVANNKSGFLVQDVDEMVDAIHNTGELDRCVVRRHVEQNFSVQAMTVKYTKLYKSVITTAKASRVRTQPLITPAKVRVPLIPVRPSPRKEVSVLVPYRSSLSAGATLEVEPTS